MTADDAVRDLYERLLTAWNERRADDFGALFEPDGVMIGFDGAQVAGSDAADHLAPIFGDHPTASYVAEVRQIRPIGTQAVLLRAIAGMVPPGGTDLNPALNAVQTLVAENGPAGWRVVLFQNTPAQYHGRPDLTEEHTAALRRVSR